MTTIEDLRRIALDHAQVAELEKRGAIVRRMSSADRRTLEREEHTERKEQRHG